MAGGLHLGGEGGHQHQQHQTDDTAQQEGQDQEGGQEAEAEDGIHGLHQGDDDAAAEHQRQIHRQLMQTPGSGLGDLGAPPCSAAQIDAAAQQHQQADNSRGKNAKGGLQQQHRGIDHGIGR